VLDATFHTFAELDRPTHLVVLNRPMTQQRPDEVLVTATQGDTLVVTVTVTMAY
jgi:hypothetical protein